jgi:hypothetical protein
VKPDFFTDQPSVEVASLKGERSGYAVLVNHSSETKRVTVRSALPLTSLRQIRPEGSQPLELEKGGWTLDLGAYEGAVVAWR